MKKRNHSVLRDIRWAGLGALALALSACCTTPPPSSSSVSRIPGTAQVFATPEQAVDAYVSAIRSDNRPELLKILGPNAAKLIYSGDPVADKTWHAKFLASYDSAHEIESEGDAKDVLVIGDEEWPVPIPLVRAGDGWRWDTAAGENEILNRRIGHNELMAVGVSLTYVEAQREFAALSDDKGHAEYAQKFVSSTGRHDGLYWPANADETESPLGPLVAEARAEGYAQVGKQDAHKRTPYHGYYYKILKQQGASAAGGAKAYIVNGHMTGGFALIAFPAKYGDSGVMSFIVNQNGIIYEKNLGQDTGKIARHMDIYNPDQSWKISDAADAD